MWITLNKKTLALYKRQRYYKSMNTAIKVTLQVLLLLLSLAAAGVMLYGFWITGFVGIFFHDQWLMAAAVGIWLLMSYLIYYRLRRI